MEKFVEEECIPADLVYFSQLGEGDKRWSTYPKVIDDLKARARKLGLWNMFLPKNHFKEGAGFSNLEYGLMAEYLGKSRVASEATNCAAPDTGNMEVIAKYGNDAQKKEWLAPLLDGTIRSAFLMTEPDIASSDATNIALTMKREGNEYVLNGSVSHLARCTLSFTNCSCRNGGPVGREILDAKSISLWVNLLPITQIPTDSNRSCLSLPIHQA